ncbi:MAG TPA: (2Fe-2S) ferredoxin domain-containing protein [Thermoanaerobaculia bacterium]|nr:(2Fe-2S) ferredoxin domain-containing protein [Thermoanaerobaculia bacterium]
MEYPFDKLFLVCTGARCNNPDRGDERSEVIRGELKDLNKSLGRKPVVRICSVSCLDLCDFGPNMVVHPEGTVYSHLDRESAKAVYAGVMGDGPARPDKELTAQELAGPRTKYE